MNFLDYQRAASQTSQLGLGEPTSAIAPMLGLASETGQILNVYKKYLRDGIGLEAEREFLKIELGDLLWYVSAVATAVNLSMEDIATANLQRTHDRYLDRTNSDSLSSIPIFDIDYPDWERFPRRLVVKFSETESPSGKRVSSLTLIEAAPNAFPSGPKEIAGKVCGYKVGGPLGADLTDNSRRADDYRFHDALHLAFLANLGWSPTMRALLQVKRRSKPEVDEAEDGARAIYAEEGMAAVLARLAEQRKGFQVEASVDGDALTVIKAATIGLEVSRMPGWLWRKAVTEGFVGMRELGNNAGGYLIADLDNRNLVYAKSI